MSSAFFMFLSPPMRVPWLWAIVAFLFGVLALSYPIVRTSRLELRDGVVYMQRSRWFSPFSLSCSAIRLLLHDYIGHLISPLQTASVVLPDGVRDDCALAGGDVPGVSEDYGGANRSPRLKPRLGSVAEATVARRLVSSGRKT